MEEKLNKAIQLITQKFKEEFGQDAQIEDGESVVGVFNDCYIKMSLIDKQIKIDVNIGKPYIFNETIF